MTLLGIFHTIISVLALILAVMCFVKQGQINFTSKWSKYYILTTIITCLTSFGIFKTGTISAGHLLAIIILMFFVIAFLINKKSTKSFSLSYLQTGLMTATVFLSCIPAVIETLTRLPVANPIADGPENPTIKIIIRICFGLLIIGLILQYNILKKTFKK